VITRCAPHSLDGLLDLVTSYKEIEQKFIEALSKENQYRWTPVELIAENAPNFLIKLYDLARQNEKYRSIFTANQDCIMLCMLCTKQTKKTLDNYIQFMMTIEGGPLTLTKQIRGSGDQGEPGLDFLRMKGIIIPHAESDEAILKFFRNYIQKTPAHHLSCLTQRKTHEATLRLFKSHKKQQDKEIHSRKGFQLF
jgi:hypothetical protein